MCTHASASNVSRFMLEYLRPRQVVADYLVGRDLGDPAVANGNTLAAMQEAKKKPTKYKLAEVLGNLVVSPDRGNSWNAVRSLRSMAATVVSNCCFA